MIIIAVECERCDAQMLTADGEREYTACHAGLGRTACVVVCVCHRCMWVTAVCGRRC